MLRRSIGFGLALTCVAAGLGLGCGDDDDKPDGGTAGSNTGGSSSGSSGSSGLPSGPRPGRNDSGVSGGSADAGFDTEMEGFPCGSTADCTGNLRCVSAGRDFQFGICARPCSSDDDCGLEACLTLSGAAADQHCVNFVRQEFGPCGSIETAACAEPRVCLGTSSQLPIGVCVSLCAVSGSADVDAGGAPIAECTSAQTCIDLDTTDPSSPGFCAGRVGHLEACEPDLSDGKLCPDADICAPVDPAADPVADFKCRKDCTMDGTCDEGTCTDIQGEFAYCVP